MNIDVKGRLSGICCRVGARMQAFRQNVQTTWTLKRVKDLQTSKNPELFSPFLGPVSYY